MNISKDESIITQVAAKIAADLVPDAGDINQNIAEWAIAFDAVLDAIKTAHNVAPAQAITGAFPGATVTSGPAPQAQAQAPTNMTVQVKGTQHGPLPDWLLTECAANGVTSVWDNRDGLAINPKRPWFKAADGTKNQRGDDMAFWPPRN